jgi:hypothetical protein
MIFNQDLLFIHIGKTGGTSCTLYLLNNLRGPVYSCHRNASAELQRLDLGREAVVALSDMASSRHATLAESLDFVQRSQGRTLADFKKVIAVIRHPLTLEYSWYRHLQKPSIQHSRKAWKRAVELASLSFEDFVQAAPYHRPGHPQEAFFLLDGQLPEQLELLRFEELETAFPAAVAPYTDGARGARLRHANQTRYTQELESVLTPGALQHVYGKHRWLFDQGYYDLSSY